MTLAPGTRRIRFRETLGKGAFGTVYLADLIQTQGLHQRVAVKIMNTQGPEAREEASRHRDEARLLAQLNHDHIVRVVDLIEVEGQLAFVMEYVEGLNVDMLVRKAGALPPRVALHIASCCAGALDAAYNAASPATGRPLRVIHRDIKPANILFTVGGGVKVLDFGIARAEFDRDSQTHTNDMGTPSFMAPELFTSDQGATPAVDVYALGLTLVRMLTGRDIERLIANPARFERSREALLAPIAAMAAPEIWREGLMMTLHAMLEYRPEERIGCAQLQERLIALMDRAPGEGPVAFARRALPPLMDELRQQGVARRETLPSEMTLAGQPVSQTTPLRPPPRPTKTATWVAGGLLGGVVVGGLGLAAVGVAAWLLLREAPVAAPPPPVAAAVTPPTQSAPPATAPPKPAVAATPKTAPTTAAPTTAPATAKTTAPATSAKSSAKTTAAAAPAPLRCGDDAAGLSVMTISSVPFGARVIVDGAARGTTPCRLPLSDGAHSLKLSLDGAEATRSLSVGSLYASHVTWDTATNSWSQAM